MVDQEQLKSSALHQHGDDEPEAKQGYSVAILDNWQLTSQQQAFIELFAEDDQPKQWLSSFSLPIFNELRDF